MEIELEKPFAYRFRPDNDYTLSELEKGYMYFQNPKNLNDPFDCYHKLMYVTKDSQELRNLFRRIAPFLTQNQTAKFEKDFTRNYYTDYSMFINQFIEAYIKRFGIVCFTQHPVNHLMWSHYANFHKGICLQFDVSKDENFFEGISPVSYIDKIEPKEFKPISKPNDILKIFYTKSNLWRKEYEIRVVKEQQGEVSFVGESLRKIIFGINTTDEYKNKVVEITKQKYPHLHYFSSQPTKRDFGISLTHIKIN